MSCPSQNSPLLSGPLEESGFDKMDLNKARNIKIIGPLFKPKALMCPQVKAKGNDRKPNRTISVLATFGNRITYNVFPKRQGIYY